MQKRCKGCYELFDAKYDICPHCGYFEGAVPQEPFQLAVGTELADRYVLGLAIGLGGFGITYKAWDKTLETVVAVKEYYPSGLVNRVPGTSEVILFSGIKRKEFEFGLARFIQEAQNMAKFSTHENIVNVFSYFEENNTAYIVMEYLDGCTLNEEMKEKGLRTIDQNVDIILDVCNALRDIHSTGIIHRDISPDNIFLCKNGTIKLIDFGAARFSQSSENNYTIILKPGFAPPEQYEQISKQGPWTDIYAVGATLYYLVTGQKPEESTNRKVKDTLQAPCEVNADVPQYLSDAILKAMAIEPNLRFKTIDEFVAVLKKEKKVRSLKQEKRMRRTVRFSGITALLLVLAAVAVVFFVGLDDKKEEVTLLPAELTVWYTQTDDAETEQVYKALAEEFCAEYPDVQIRWADGSAGVTDGGSLFLKDSLPEAQTPARLLDLSACAGTDDGKKSLKKLFSKSDRNCLFLDQYDDYFPEHTQLPIGFIEPVLFVNTTLCAFESDSVSSAKEILELADAEHIWLVNETMQPIFAQIFPDADSAYIVYGTRETFLNGGAAFYFGGADEFFAVRTMPSMQTGIPKTVEIKADTLPCVWGPIWSVTAGEEAQNAAAIRFLQFLLSDNAQAKLFCRVGNAHALPINLDALSTFCDIFDEMSFLNAKTGSLTVIS